MSVAKEDDGRVEVLRSLLVRCEGVLSITRGSTAHFQQVLASLLSDIRRELALVGRVESASENDK